MSATNSKTNQSILLRDGRRLGYAEYGAPGGKPVFLFHGLFGSRLQRHPDDSIAANLGVRVIATDRPGFGLSDSSAGRTLLDWPDDVMELADALNIDRFAVLGVSAGGPYAAACACKIPQHLSDIAIVSGIGPLDIMRAGNDTAWRHRLLFMSAQYAPWLLPLPLTIVSEILRRYPARFLAGMAAALSDSDRAILARPEIKFMLKHDASEAYRQGTAGAIQEIALLSQPWKFTPQDISVEVKLWHGDRDNIVPVRVGNYMSQALPHCQATFIAGGGHFLIIDYWRQILAALITFPEFRRIDGYEPGK